LYSALIKGIIMKKLILLALMLISNLANAATYYVDTNGDNLNTGISLSTPFKTIQKAMDTAIAGDTVFVRGGVYREQVIVAKGGGAVNNLVEVLAYNNEVPVIKGSDVVTGWVKYSGNIWAKSNWLINSQQVFAGGGDSNSLQQIGMPSSLYSAFNYPSPVGSGVASMVAGSFYYDKLATTLYVWLADGSDPNAQVMEVSSRNQLLFMKVPYIHVKGFTFRHSNTSAYKQIGAAVELSTGSVIESSDIQYTDFAGLQMGYLQTGSQAINCNISNNGDSGVNAAATNNFIVHNVKMNGNNTRKFNPLWHAGGFKAATKAYGIVEYSEAANNYASGIWFDYANSGSPIIIRNNYIHNNGPKEAAIFFEVSNNGLIYNNVIANNERRGIYISASDNTRVYNNTIYATKGYAGIDVNGMPRTGATLTNNSVYNNIISHGTSTIDLYFAVPNGTTILGNSSDYNNYYRSTGAIQLYSGVMYSILSTFTTATGQDAHSMNVDSSFVSASNPSSASSYAEMSSSPVIDKGTTVAGVSQDYLNVARPAAAAFDLGAFEYGGTATSGGSTTSTSSDTTAPVVTISNPIANAVIIRGSTVTIMASATDNVSVTAMSLYVDGGSNVRSSNGQISFTWNSTGAKIGTHSIKVSASDARNNLGGQYITFKVQQSTAKK